jgi:GAF domain-containing protein
MARVPRPRRAPRLLERTRHTARLQRLAEASLEVNSARSLDEVLRIVTETAREIVGARQSVTILTVDGNWAQAITQVSLSDKYAAWREYDEKPDGSGIYRLVCELNRPMRMTQAELEAHPAWRGFGQAAGKHPPLRGWLAAPLIGRRGENLGLIQLSDKEEGEFTAEDEAVLVQLAQMASVAIENARLYADAERRRREAESLAEVGRLLSHSRKPREVAQRIVDHVLALFPVQAAIVFELVPGGSALRVVTAAGDSGLFAPGATFRAGSGVTGIAVRDRQPVSTTDALGDPRVALTPEARRWYEATGYRAVLAFPFLVHDRVLGGLSLADVAGRVYTADEVRMAQAFADQAAVALENARLYAEAERRQREAEELARISRTLTESLDFGLVSQRIVESVLPLFDVPTAVLRLLQPDGSLLAVTRAGPTSENLLSARHLPPGIGVSARAAAEGRPVWTRDAVADPRIALTDALCTRADASRRPAILAVPFRVKGEVKGVLAIGQLSPRDFSEREASLLQTFADQAAVALENARLYADAERRQREAEVLTGLAHTINASLDPDTVLQRVAEGARELCASDGASVAVRDTASDAMVIRYQAREQPRWRSFRIEAGKGVGGLVLVTGRPFRTDDYARDPRITKDYLADIQAGGIMAEMAVPIRIDGWVEGLLYVSSRSERHFSDLDEAVLLRLADHAAVAIRNARHFEQTLQGRARLAALSRRLVEIQEAERRHIARELHDEIGQLLTGLKLTLEMDVSGRRRDEAHRLVQDLIGRVREMSLTLRPPVLDDFGLVPTLLWHLERYGAQTGVRVRLEHRGLDRRFPSEIETAAYRIVQEALTNVARHAGVTEATVRAWADAATLHVQVVDGGRGFDTGVVASASSGLSGMRERARFLGGRLSVESAPGGGTRLHAELPVTDVVEPRREP